MSKAPDRRVPWTTLNALAAQQLAWRLAERSLFRPLYLEERAFAEWIDFGGEV